MNSDVRLTSAVLFMNPSGISFKELVEITNIKKPQVEVILDKLSKIYTTLGLELIIQKDDVMLVVSNDVARSNSKLIKESDHLSNTALEVLSIIAYQQPISREDIENIRGIGSEQSIRGLLERELIVDKKYKISGIYHTKYSTTINFLKQLGIRSLSDLPVKENTI